jgi:hypothetical protein
MHELLSEVDFYGDEYQQFEWDVNVLIKGTLDASLKHLDTKIETDLAAIKAAHEKNLMGVGPGSGRPGRRLGTPYTPWLLPAQSGETEPGQRSAGDQAPGRSACRVGAA